MNFSHSKAERCYLHLPEWLLRDELMHISARGPFGPLLHGLPSPSDVCGPELENPASCSPTGEQ